jgi:hypothetical protein
MYDKRHEYDAGPQEAVHQQVGRREAGAEAVAGRNEAKRPKQRGTEAAHDSEECRLRFRCAC